MKEIFYRDVELGDAPKLIDFMNTVLRETNYLRLSPEEFFPTIEQEEAFVNEFISNNASKMIIALDNSEIVGVGSIEGSKFIKLKHNGEYGIAVRKSHWNMGIAKTITTMLIVWARENKALKKVGLHVNSENQTAISFYKSIGFVTEGILKRDFYYEKRYIDTILMALDVDF